MAAMAAMAMAAMAMAATATAATAALLHSASESCSYTCSVYLYNEAPTAADPLGRTIIDI